MHMLDHRRGKIRRGRACRGCLGRSYCGAPAIKLAKCDSRNELGESPGDVRCNKSLDLHGNRSLHVETENDLLNSVRAVELLTAGTAARVGWWERRINFNICSSGESGTDLS